MRPSAHYCITDDVPPMKIVCLCSTGRDHTEEEFDSPASTEENEAA